MKKTNKNKSAFIAVALIVVTLSLAFILKAPEQSNDNIQASVIQAAETDSFFDTFTLKSDFNVDSFFDVYTQNDNPDTRLDEKEIRELYRELNQKRGQS